MTLVFWQGMISIHQKAFLEEVAAHAAVTGVLLVVEHDISPYRKNMGWDIPAIAGVEVIIAPPKQKIKEIVAANKEAIHIMGGVRVGPMLALAFDRCVKEHCRLGIMTEPYNDAGFKGKLRRIKYHYYKRRYFRYVQFVLAIGRLGVKQYTSLGFDTRRIFPWAYFVDVPQVRRTTEPSAKKRMMYAGRLEPAKGILRFTEQLLSDKNDQYTFDIYGEGPDEGHLKQLITAANAHQQIKIHPFIPHSELLQQYSKYDWVVLPSAAKDGWGVIVSEGLLSGLKALCSSICGVSRVIKNGENGLVFDWNKEGSCRTAINTMLGSNTFADTDAISRWAQQGISARAGTAYFMQIIDCVYEDQKKPALPWE